MRNPSATPTHRAPATTIVSCPDAFGRSPSRLTIAARALVRLDDHTGLARLPRPWGRPGPSPPAGAGGDQGAPKRAAGGWREFVATASHELRTPLASLEGMLELLRDDLGDERPDLEDARALVERAHAQARRLGRLASDLLDLSRIDAQVRLRSEPVELGELCRAVLAEFELRGEQRGVVVVLREAGVAVWALGDPGSVAQIVRILLDNALRVSPVGGRVEVVLGCGGVASLSVCDWGPGVAVDEREVIFERFHRGRDTGGEAGFGLGLAIGRELARRMGGELVLEDGPPEGAVSGAVFTLRLPLAPAADHETLAAA